MSKHMAKLQADKLDLMGDHAMENGQLATAEHWYDKADAIREEYGIEEDIGPGMKKMKTESLLFSPDAGRKDNHHAGKYHSSHHHEVTVD